MEKENRGRAGWSDMNSVVSQSLGKLSALPDQRQERLALFWALAVGRENAERTEITRVTDRTLYVAVKGAEWLPALKSMEGKFLSEINRRCGTREFSRIVYRVAQSQPAATPTPAPRTEPSRSAGGVFSGPLNMIHDPELRATLKRLGTKFRLSAGFLLVFFLANCASVERPAFVAEETDDTSFAQSYAVRQVQEIRKQHPEREVKDPRAYYYYLLALKYEREADFERAARYYALTVRYDPKNEVFNERAVTLNLRSGHLDEAVTHAQKALEWFPNNIAIRMTLADILGSRGEHAEALGHYKIILDQDPSQTRALLMYGRELEKLGRSREARDQYKQLTLTDPNNPLGFFYAGMAFGRIGELTEAEDLLKKAINLRPSFLEARQNLARVFEDQNALDRALAQFKIILKLNPHNEVIQKQMERAKKARSAGGRETPAGKDYQPVEWSDPNEHLLIGALYYEQAIYLEALDEFRLALVAREDKELRMVIAKIYELFGRVDMAIREIEAYQATRAGKPPEVDVLLSLARLYGLNKEMGSSIKYLNQAIQLDPNNDRLYHALALAYMAINEVDLAIMNIRKAIEINDQKDVYYFELGALYERQGKFQEAIEAMNKTLEINPNHSNAHNFIGYLYATMGKDLDKALDHLEQALTIQPRNGYFLDSLGWIYFKQGQSKKALDHIKKAMIYTEPDPVLYDHLGDVLFALDNIYEARKAWQTSLALTLKKLKEPVGEIPDPKKLEEKIRKADQLLQPDR